MTDLTKITTPFGLLDAETQDALRAHGGPYETWAGCDPTEWKNCPSPAWMGAGTYRVKPQPPKPREWWLCRDNEDDAFFVCYGEPAYDVWTEIIHVREVLE